MENSKEAVFNELMKENHASIYRICRAYLYDKSHSDDLYQEILYQIWKSLRTFKQQANVKTWIYRIAVNTAINYNIKNKRSQLQPLPDQFQVVFEETVSEKTEQENQLNKLRYCINQLDSPDRLLISLVLEDKSYKEIAEITGSTTNHVGVRISRIKSRLLKLMERRTEYEL